MDKNLTDSEIVRILEETIEYNNRIGRPTAIMDIYSLELFLDLINRLQEKNSNLTSDLTSLHNDLTSAKAEGENITEKFNCQQTVYADLSKIIKDKNAEIERLKT